MLNENGEIEVYFPDLSKVKPEVNEKVALKHTFGGRDYPENHHKSFLSKDLVVFLLCLKNFEVIEEIPYKGPHHPWKEPMAWTTGLKVTKGDS
jgi:hypothetical protein